VQVEIRKLTIKDYDAIIKLWGHAGLPHKSKGRDSKEVIERQMREFPDFFLGAFRENKLVGVVIGSYESRMKGWINRLAVDPEYRRQGIGERLVARMEETLKRRGARILAALIEMPNEESFELFQKMGYKSHKDILYVTKRESQEV
jgi:ribosomal protein S18 acetylase RimI-like enzyme